MSSTEGGRGAGAGAGSASGGGHIFRSLSSESQKREWSKRLSLRGMRHGGGGAGGAGGTGAGTGAGGPATSLSTGKEESKHRKFFSRSASLKQAGSGVSQQASMELHVPGQGGASSPQTQTQPSTPKKSNWEVIEHFNTSAKGGKAMVSSSLIAVSRWEHAMPHASCPMPHSLSPMPLMGSIN
ncbi:GL17985 [Drosophila persimilis]|uniref:GL17985 n=1 Tax=Drosophila persimilis TaxID=7234 RepID=B4H212_DROPE|nr:GL17985 [Drosophila persimilis]